MQRALCARLVAGALAVASGQAGAQTSIVVTPLDSDESSMAQPASVLRGDDLRRRQGSSLGDTLDREPGVHSGGMGPGASRPVIRGQDAPRVRVLDNGSGTMDVSSISPDHAPAVETLGASQVEILRGPATLLYGGGAIGGLVNVVNKRIPTDRLTGFSGAAELRFGGAGREGTGAVDLNGGQGGLSWHVDAFNRHARDYRAPGGTVANSFVESRGASAGASLVGDRGYLGASVQVLSSFYGVPAGERARIDLDQARFDLAGELRDPLPGFSRAKLRFGRNQYRHDEVEQNGDIATQFRNNAHEGRLELTHLPIGPFRGVFGLSFHDRRFSAVGEESFIAPTKSRGQALFLVEEFRAGQVRFELGGRAEGEHHRPEAGAARSFGLASWSGGAVWEFMPGYNTGISLTSAQRAPAIEELYANGPHAGTASFDVGDSNLRKERSTNIDLTLRKTTGAWRWKASAYQNRFRGYIYAQRQDVDGDGVFDPALDRVDDAGTADPAGDFFLVNYRQANARFRGFEGEIAYRPEHGFGGRVFADVARGRLAGAGNVAHVARMSPSRLGLEGRYLTGPWDGFATLLFVFRQDRIAVTEETATPGYTRLDAGLSYRVRHSDRATTTLFLQANNLLDEDMRVHTSFIKDSAPLPGRSLFAGLRSNF